MFFFGILSFFFFIRTSNSYGNTDRNFLRTGEEDSSEVKEFYLISYNDVYDLLQIEVGGIHLGGISRAAEYIQSFKKNNPNTLTIFAGDTLSPSSWSYILKGKQMIDSHNLIGCDFACLGNHEFDYGREVLGKAFNDSKFPWLNANVFEMENGTQTDRLLQGTQPNAIVDVNGVRIGLFGVMYDMKDYRWSAYWKDPLEVSRQQVAELKARGADFIIAITHQDKDSDSSLSSKVSGIDIILGGHDHRSMLIKNQGTTFLKADSDLRSLWVTKVSFYTQKRKSSFNHESISITHDLALNMEAEELIAKYTAIFEEETSHVVGESCEDIPMDADSARYEESLVGNFVADSHRWAYDNIVVETAVMNGGGLRSTGTLRKGNVTFRNILAWVPFDNFIYVVRINGKILQKIIHESASKSCSPEADQSNGDILHPSGFQYVFECGNRGSEAGKVTKLLWRQENKTGDILDEEEFNLAVNDHSFRTLVHIFDELDESSILVNEKEAFQMAVVIKRGIDRNGGLVCPKLENRFKIIL